MFCKGGNMNVGMLFSLMGGLGLFLYGMKLMGEGLERAAGDKLRSLLGTLTRNRMIGVLVGTCFTAVIQSSSATTVMVVGFVNASLMSLQQAVGVIMGANIGTTITGQLVAFHLDEIAPVFLLAGVAMMMFSKSPRTQRLGQIIAGFGLLFVGMGMMSQAMEPLRENERFLSVTQSVGSSPLLAVLVGAAITTIIQSSSASVALTQVLAGQGLIPLDMAIYMCLGCAIGTCVTAMLASVGTGPTARRAAVIHLLFNIAGALLMLLILQAVPLADFMRDLSPNDVKRQIANANTLMKLTEVLVLFPFANLLILASGWLVRGEEPKGEERKLMYLDDLILTTPPIAVAQVLKEVERMARVSIDNLERAMRAYFAKDASLIPEVRRTESVIDYLNHEITSYLIKLGQTALPPNDVPVVASLYHVVNDLERVGDHAMNMAEFAQISMDDSLVFTQQGEEEMRDMFSDVLTLLNLALSIFPSRARAKLQQAADLEERVDDKEKLYQQRHVARLSNGVCTPQSGMVFTDMLSNLERVADHATNIAFSIASDGVQPLFDEHG